MTAYPNPSDFGVATGTEAQPSVMRPNVTEHYWGYEVRPNQQVINAAVILRGACALFAVASFCAALGVWMLPAMAFAMSATAGKVAVSALLLCVGGLLTKMTMRGTRVRVQVDTANGELREVVDGPFGSVFVLAHYGLDAVEAVEIVSSADEPSFGQIQLTVANVGTVPVGDGSVLTLQPLRDRLVCDCGIKQGDRARVAIWGGPIAA